MRARTLGAVAIVLTSLSLLSLTTRPVYAHEHRDVTIAGTVTDWTVGWGVEPAFVDQMNMVFLGVGNSTGTPVKGLQVLQVEVKTGPSSTILNLTRVFGVDGEYKAEIMPTVPGTYIFRFFGNANGTTINESFTCVQTGQTSEPGSMFDCVEPLSDAQFPVETPSLRDIQTSLNNLGQGVLLATVIGGAGIVVGVAGILVGLFVARRSPRSQTGKA